METITKTTTTTNRLDFDLVESVEDAMFMAFNADRDLENEDVNPDFFNLFGVFLTMSGWNDIDYHEEMDKRIKAARAEKEETVVEPTTTTSSTIN